MGKKAVVIAVLIWSPISISQTKFFPQGSFKPEANSISYLNTFHQDVNSFYYTGIQILESPFHFDSRDFLMTGIILSATAISFSLDHPVREGVSKIHSGSVDQVGRLAEKFGNPRYGLALSGAIYLTGYFSENKEIRKTGLMLLEGIFMNGLITEGLKVMIGRSRPHNNEGNFDIDFMHMEADDNDHSLPSGHTSTVFTIATILSNRIGNPYITAVLYSAAGLTAFQRIQKDHHWISDTIFGAALGTVVGLKVIKLNSEINSSSEDLSLNIFPQIGTRSYSVNLSVNF